MSEQQGIRDIDQEAVSVRTWANAIKANVALIDRLEASENKHSLALEVIDRIDTALRADGRSAMLIVTAQQIITQYREEEGHGDV